MAAMTCGIEKSPRKPGRTIYIGDGLAELETSMTSCAAFPAIHHALPRKRETGWESGEQAIQPGQPCFVGGE
jgi:hypothetical protein